MCFGKFVLRNPRERTQDRPRERREDGRQLRRKGFQRRKRSGERGLGRPEA